jgi:hypothetical protein
MTYQPITIHFIHSPDYKLHPVTGAWGGVVAGHIMIHFYIDKVTIPEKIAVDELGQVGETSDQRREREITTGCIMTPETARNVGKFLLSIAKQLDQAKEETEKNENVTH